MIVPALLPYVWDLGLNMQFVHGNRIPATEHPSTNILARTRFNFLVW